MLQKSDPKKILQRAKYFAGAFLFFVFVLALFHAVGRFFIVIFLGLAVATLFFTIYNFALSIQVSRPVAFAKPRRETKKSEELKAYIQFHLPIVISVLLIGFLIALIILFWVA